MREPHVAFILESSHGHVNPVLGMAAELVRRGCRVTFAVKSYFAARVLDCGAEPVIYQPLDYKLILLPKVQSLNADAAEVTRLSREFEQEELEYALPQLEHAYGENRPDLIVYDLRNLAGKALASKWDIPTVEHAPIFIHSNEFNQNGRPYDGTLIIASIPRAFQPHADALDERFHFVGPIYNRRAFFRPWNSDARGDPVILISSTTAESEPDIFRISISAFESFPYRVVLSIGDEIDPRSLGTLPPNFEINQFSSHLEILEHASLFVYQGGLSSTLEAFYCGVPTLVIPVSRLHDEVAVRIAELGLGTRLEHPTTAAVLGRAASHLLRDGEVKGRVEEMQKTMRAIDGGKLAGDVILGSLARRCGSLGSPTVSSAR